MMGLPLKVGRKKVEARFTYKDDPMGRSSETHIVDVKGNILGYGIAMTHPNDQFCRRTGRKLSFGRALTAMLKREYRAKVWAQYFGAFPEN